MFVIGWIVFRRYADRLAMTSGHRAEMLLDLPHRVRVDVDAVTRPLQVPHHGIGGRQREAVGERARRGPDALVGLYLVGADRASTPKEPLSISRNIIAVTDGGITSGSVISARIRP